MVQFKKEIYIFSFYYYSRVVLRGLSLGCGVRKRHNLGEKGERGGVWSGVGGLGGEMGVQSYEVDVN